MTTTTKTRKVAKIVQIIARYVIHRNGFVVYAVRPSAGGDPYYTTLVNGKATGCTCPATKPCYHMTQLEEKEAARKEAAQAVQEAERIVRYNYSPDHPWYGLTDEEIETARANYEMAIDDRF